MKSVFFKRLWLIFSVVVCVEIVFFFLVWYCVKVDGFGSLLVNDSIRSLNLTVFNDSLLAGGL